jgi:2-polyprenyl-6-methoxyphenol hydroxylase-like FAD-dependent oxidoreductase
MSAPIGAHAVVIGAGIGGLMAARVLADKFARVTVVERDGLASGTRNGAPQANHFHVLLRLGFDLLEKTFPGMLREMEADGVAPVDFARDLCWLQYGGWMPRQESRLVLYPQTRYSLESHIRRRLGDFANIEFLPSTAVKALRTTADRKRVTGVAIAAKDDAPRDLAADLVVDAGGRASQIFKWLQQIGYQPPEETRLPINLCYVTRMFEPSAGERNWKGLWVSPLAPEVPRGGALQHVEGCRWIVSLFGYHGDRPPNDDDGFLEFARSLLHPALYETIRNARPVSDFHVYRVPDERWRHLERLKSFPDGLLILGDAFCYFDPVFGQGMSMAMMEADVLRKRLRRVTDAKRLTSRWAVSYFRACAAWIQGVWYFVWAEALRHPAMPGDRPRAAAWLQWLVTELYDLNRTYPRVYMKFLRLMHMQSGPVVLLHPEISFRLATRALRRAAFGPKPKRVPAGDMPA